MNWALVLVAVAALLLAGIYIVGMLLWRSWKGKSERMSEPVGQEKR